MNAHSWIKSLVLEDLPDMDSYGAMWADGCNKVKTKKGFKKFKDLTRKFPFVINGLFNECGYSSYLEIGVAYGGGIRLVHKCNPKVTMFGIDPITHVGVKKHFESLNGKGRGGYDGTIFQNKKLNFFKNLSTDSAVIKYFNTMGKSIDFINVDGDHSYEVCLSDLENYAPCVSLGGMIWVDDVAYIPGVKQALEEFMNSEGSEGFEMWDWEGKGYLQSKKGIDGVFLLRK